MNRPTYIALALSTTLATGVLLAVTYSHVPLSNSPPAFITPSPDTRLSKIETFVPLPLEPTCQDPALTKQADYFYVFSTGNTINSLRSKDLIHWEFPPAPPSPTTNPARGPRTPRPGIALPGIPNSLSAILPTTRDLSTPAITFYNNHYLLFYAATNSRTSAIGLATNKTLDPTSKDYQWHDDGIVLRSTTTDPFNALNPNFVLDEKSQPWLAFGSQSTGIKLRKLTPDGHPDPTDPTLYPLAARTPPDTAIEAPFLIHESRYFYLFVSCDARVLVGRSEKITGPYLDQSGKPMLQGGGTQLLTSDPQSLATPRFTTPSHPALFKDEAGSQWLLALHFHDATTQNTPRLQIRPVTFDNQQWPVAGTPINSPG